MSQSPDRACLSYWYPPLVKAGLPVPETGIVRTDADLSIALDGMVPQGWDGFMLSLRHACDKLGYPLFLRTGHGSGKHDWNQTCYVEHNSGLGANVVALVEWSHLVDIGGLPHNVWCPRKLIPTTPLFHAFRGNMPITREFRLFVKGGYIEHIQPYWPPDSIWAADEPDWKQRLHEAARLSPDEIMTLRALALKAGSAVDFGTWSVDLLQSSDASWWITDMAPGERSFRWCPEGPGAWSVDL